MYGYSNYAKKKEQWNFIQRISSANSNPWVVLGDLNFHILDNTSGTSSSTDGWVKNIVSSCGLEDIGYVGKDFTWTNNNMGIGIIKCRIDLALGNGDWSLNYPNSILLHLAQLGSDHSPIMLDTDVTLPNCESLLSFFGLGLNDASCSTIIANAWKERKERVNGSPAFQLVNKMHITRKILPLWNKEHFSDINQQVNKLQQDLQQLQEHSTTSDNNNEIININNELNKWHKIKTEFYQQNSRDNFIKDMDAKSKYFHNKVNRRKTRNNIDLIQDHNNTWLQSREQISQHLTQHFQSISSTCNSVINEGLYTILPTIISEEANISLNRIPTDEEIYVTLKIMENWSAPGPEGFQASFYKSQWNIVGEDVCLLVKRFFGTKHVLKQINKTYISLIPKKKKCVGAAEYRPIGLCNTSYKVISKVIVNRMKPLREKIISPFQEAYVSRRLNNDNTVIAQEIIHSMKKKRGETGWLALKLDMSKAFDSSQSGQVINFDKSAIHFSKKTKPEIAETLRQILGVKTMNSKERYLGSPLIFWHSKQEHFKSIKQSFENRLSTWSAVSMSQAGRGTMIKRVLNAIPIYQMGPFKLPANLLQQLTSIERRFFWGYNSNRGNNPTTWLNLCRPTEMGDLAFRNLEKLNLAMLTKLAWRLCNEPDNLMTRVLSSKYLKSGDIIHQNISAKNCSYVWNGITKWLSVVQQNYFMEINNGLKTKIWKERWIPGINHPPLPKNDLFRFYETVAELFLPETSQWNVYLLENLFDHDTSLKIQAL
ncbi:uncharacterized protein LOC113305157 [Papaver somniferum]|uniref:uncharacterized protein LOC113305157 n=1 Tax=Papaver somniferum TaxID=3469 RepID=UPI000E704099|nr:uncharacterized protein LOC113305157 [Papaver somniferum]